MAVTRRPSAPLAAALVVFPLGAVALAAVFAGYLTGHHDLPLWLNVCAGTLIPTGLGLGLFALLSEARADRRRQPAAGTAPSTQSANSVKSDSTTSAPAARS